MGLLNDYFYGVDPQTSQANIEAIIAKMKAIQPNGTETPGFLILLEWLRGDVSSLTYPWSAYRAVAQKILPTPTRRLQLLILAHVLVLLPLIVLVYIIQIVYILLRRAKN